MAEHTRNKTIFPLPAEVRAQIRSSIAITTLNDVVIELVKNALDAGSSNIKISLDVGKGACEVGDNGMGISAADFAPDGGLGQQFCTSKQVPLQELYGRHGQFLASLATLSLLSITSRQAQQDHESTLISHRSRVLQRRVVGEGGLGSCVQDHGTVVAVHDLFGNMPVRVKDRALRGDNRESRAKHMLDLRQRLVVVLLAWSRPVRLHVIDNEDGANFSLQWKHSDLHPHHQHARTRGHKRPFDIRSIGSLFAQAFKLGEQENWTTISARTLRYHAKAAICLVPTPTKQMQFVSIGIVPLHSTTHSVLYEEINRLFTNSKFGVLDTESEIDEQETMRRRMDRRYKADGMTQRRLREQRRGVDRYPMFYIRFERASDEAPLIPPIEVLHNDRVIEDLLELLRSTIWHFLEQNGFQPDKPRRKRMERPVEQMKRSQVSAHRVCLAEEVPTPSSESQVLSRPQSAMSRPSSAMSMPSRVFSDWTRSKSSRRGGLDELGSSMGLRKADMLLPNSSRSALSTSTERDAVSMPNVGEIDDPDMDIIFQEFCQSQTVNESHPASSHDEPTMNGLAAADKTTDEIILWKDPASGNTIQINARTGNALPISNVQSGTAENRPGSAASHARSLRLPLTKPDLTTTTSAFPWSDGVLKDWKNPVFKQLEQPILSMSADPSEAKHQHFKTLIDGCSLQAPTTMSRIRGEALSAADVIGQVDDKFILVSMSVCEYPDSTSGTDDRVLVLIDQHAADERCRVEKLFEDLCNPSKTERSALVFEVSSEEGKLLQRDEAFFASWNIQYKVERNIVQDNNDFTTRPSSSTSQSSKLTSKLRIEALPSVIAERCRLSPNLLIDLLRSEIWHRHDNVLSSTQPSSSQTRNTSTMSQDWIHRLPTCPKPLVKMINSRACRSAIMFNDTLTREECAGLVGQLGRCRFPWICAHGRNCVVVVGRVGSGGVEGMGGEGEEEGMGVGEAWGRWIESLE